jgi:hypothetical protein
MNQECAVTQDLNSYLSSREWKEKEEEEQESDFLQNTLDLMYDDNETGLSLRGEKLDFDDVLEEVINHEDFKKCMLEIVKQEYLPMRDLIRECAEKLVRLAE